MENFEALPQFNSEDNPEQPKNPAIERDIKAGALSEKKEVLENVREKNLTEQKYWDLKQKEYSGRLNQEEFDQLLKFDFQEQIKSNPPIMGIFSPEEELARIKKLPKEQKREALAVFKDKLARQRDGLATCRVFIERSIEFNPDTPREKLMELVDKFSAQYGFNDYQREIIKKLIDGYFYNRKKALNFRQKFQDDYELVSELTGVKIDKSSYIRVAVGPMTIDIDTDAFNTGRLYEKSDKPIIAFRYGGFAAQSTGKNRIYYIVVNHDKEVRRLLLDPTGELTRKHEYEHQKNRLFRAVLEQQLSPTDLTNYSLEQDPEIKKIILEDIFNKHRRFALELVKDEIAARSYNRDLSVLQANLEWFFFSKEGPYDYLANVRDWKLFKTDQLSQETAQRMLVQEYRAIIEKAIASFAKLIEKGGYSKQKAIALLTDKDLIDWPKTVRRLLEQKEIN